MAKKVYIGVISDVPTYESADELNSTTITNWFDVTNGSYYFEAEDELTEFTSNNKGVKKSTATTTLKSKYNVDIELGYSYSSEENYDLFTLTIAGITIEDKVSGSTTSKTWSGSLTAGQEISFTYKKDSSTNRYNDECKFSFSSIRRVVNTTSKPAARKVKNIYVGVDGVARRIRKGYIGVGGVAKLCYITPGIHRYGNITPLSVARRNHAATSVGNYALFGGGWDANNSTKFDTVDAYNSSLTRTIATPLGVARDDLGATSVGNYALFGGGHSATVDAYNSSLTRSTVTSLTGSTVDSSATSVGNYALFSLNYGNDVAVVNAYDTSLTRTRPTSLTVHVQDANAATSVGNYALFSGGRYSVDKVHYANDVVDVYNTSLTKSVATPMSIERCLHTATSIDNYAIIAGGATYVDSSYDYTDTVDAYNTSLTKTILTPLEEETHSQMATSVGNYALFAGGLFSGTRVYVYDQSLVRTRSTNLSRASTYGKATSIGNYALFGGGAHVGASGAPTSNLVEVYVYQPES